MGHIKEPVDIDLVIAPSIVTEEDFAVFSAAIAAYKAAKNKKQYIKNLKKQKALAVA
ncbi:MAG: hypothetical protein RLZZ292_2491 [Bacteroidota bacterium]|jgi:hypothetical protein